MTAINPPAGLNATDPELSAVTNGDPATGVSVPAGLYRVHRHLACVDEELLVVVFVSDGWTRRGHRRLRRRLLALSLALSALISVAIVLPVTPIRDLHNTPFQYDIGETVAWPTYVREIASAWNRLPSSVRAQAAILTSNYGEAGAVDRYGPALGLPPAYSGHMGFWYWGQPPESATTVLGVGFDPGYLRRFFAHVRLVSRLNNHLDVNNDEQHAPLWLATGLREHWTLAWPRLKNLD